MVQRGTPLQPTLTLADLGWSADFQSQLDPNDSATSVPARITVVHRDRVEALLPDGPVSLTLPPRLSTHDVAVGDWVLTDLASGRVARVLERRSVLSRRAAGTGIDRQLIGANLDGLAIVTSCNAEFSAARLERYLAMAQSSGIAPILILTKADSADPAPFVAEARMAGRGAPVLAVDARDPMGVAVLAEWCGPGRTLGLVGSSGVGKSTLAASLTGTFQATAGIRDDDKGRHTTTARFLLRTLAGGWLLDTPGMRELRLTDAAEGIAATYEDIDVVAQSCRFGDCAHDTEPGCAIRAAVGAGTLDPDRLHRWQKLIREDRHNAETLAEARKRARGFGKMARGAMKAKTDRRDV